MQTRSLAAGSGPSTAAWPMLHPIALVALTILIVNDHLLKATAPGFVAGKLSDVAGLVVLPLLAVSLARAMRPTWEVRRVEIAVLIATGIGFGLVKTTSVGDGAFGWGLGAIQWVATLGPLRGGVLAPVANTMDPTDLFALPALVVPWWILEHGRESRPVTDDRQGPSPAAVVILIVAGLATMATSQSSSSSRIEEFEADVRLTPGTPVAVRRLDATVIEGDDAISSVSISAIATEMASSDTAPVQQLRFVQFSLVADATDIEIPIGSGYVGGTPGQGLDLTNLCRDGCEHGFSLIARLGPDAPDDGVDVHMKASLEVGTNAVSSSDVEVSLAEDESARMDGEPSNISTGSDGFIDVGTLSPTRRDEITLTVDTSRLGDVLEFPLAGRLSIRVEPVTGTGHVEAAEVRMIIDGVERWLDLGQTAEIDWLARCRAGTRCVVTVVLETTYQGWMNAPMPSSVGEPHPTEPVPGSVHLLWTAEARLEAFDGRELPIGAMQVTAP